MLCLTAFYVEGVNGTFNFLWFCSHFKNVCYLWMFQISWWNQKLIGLFFCDTCFRKDVCWSSKHQFINKKKDVTPINWSFALVDFWNVKWMWGDILHVCMCVWEREWEWKSVFCRCVTNYVVKCGFSIVHKFNESFSPHSTKEKKNSKNVHLIFLNDAYVRYLLTTITFVRYWHFWHFWVGDVFMRRQEQHHFALFIFYWYNIQ